MKKMKQFLALAIAMIMVLGIGAMTASAANDGTITIQNTVNGQTYNVYKVFDATYSGTNVAYTYDGSNATFLAALQTEASPFTATANSGTPVTYNIAIKSGKTAADITTFLNAQKANLGSVVATKTGDGNTQTVSGLAYGYYYITTTTGTAVTIDSAIKDATVVDKNEVIPPPEKTESVGTYTNVDAATANVGDTVNYKVTGTIQRYKGETLVTNLKFSDTMTAGLTPCAASGITIKVTPPGGTQRTLASSEYTATSSGQTITITIPTATVSGDDVTFNFPTGTAYEITYSAVVNENSIVPGNDTNTVSLYYNNDQTNGSDTATIENYKVQLKKTDENNAALKGAKFRLYDAATGGNEVTVVLVPFATAYPEGTEAQAAVYGTAESTVDNIYRKAKTTESGVEMVSGKTGIIQVKGLKNGTYYFQETEAPQGYNILTERKAATINDADAAQITVQNETGVELPSTGGIGTTIFYIIGAILVIGAVVVLVTRRRMNVQ